MFLIFVKQFMYFAHLTDNISPLGQNESWLFVVLLIIYVIFLTNNKKIQMIDYFKSFFTADIYTPPKDLVDGYLKLIRLSSPAELPA